MAGEREAATVDAALKLGSIAIDDAVVTALRQKAGGMPTPAAAAAAPAAAAPAAAPAAIPFTAFAPAAAAAGGPAAAALGGGAGTKSLATMLCHPPKATSDPYSASSPPLYQTATFAQPSATTFGEYDYTRSGNPTRSQLEKTMAELEGASRSFAFTSGMAALAVAMRLVPQGGHIVTGDDIYGGTSRLLQKVAPDHGIEVTNVDMMDVDAVQRAIIPGKTKLVWMESPTNPRMQVVDVAAIAGAARAGGALSLVDNSIMAPVLQQPLSLGVDICMTSATKFISGHSDVTAGILSVAGDELADRVYFLQNSEGGGLSPFDCWLCLRGIKTMALRMERQQQNCEAIAGWLQDQSLIKKINYPGLPTDPGYALQMKQARGGGSLLSFETGNVDASKALVSAAELFKVTVSFGSTTSLISLPCFMSHASIPAEIRAARGLPDDLVRISAGIEAKDDLIADLAQAFAKGEAAAGAGAAFVSPLAAFQTTPQTPPMQAQAAAPAAPAAAAPAIPGGKHSQAWRRKEIPNVIAAPNGAAAAAPAPPKLQSGKFAGFAPAAAAAPTPPPLFAATAPARNASPWQELADGSMINTESTASK